MLEFKKICDAYEKMSAVERGALLTEKAASVLEKLNALSAPGVDPVRSLAGFIVGSVTADGRWNETEYLLIYPALLRVFGDNFDFTAVKNTFYRDRNSKKQVAEDTAEMCRVLSDLDEDTQQKVITLCLCIASMDGKIDLKEKRYIRRLCDACT